MQRELNYKGFLFCCLLCIAVAAYLFYITFSLGVKESFLLLNGDQGKMADLFFTFITHFGDALLWLPMFLFIIIKRKKLFLGLAIGSFAIATILVQVCKFFIFPNEPRPTHAITDGSLIHTVEGVVLKTIGSFPSSHTTTAFVFFLMVSLMTSRKWWVPVGFFTAVMVGYSRIYLAQHFPLDVAAGITVAMVSVALSIPFQQWIDKRYKPIDSLNP